MGFTKASDIDLSGSPWNVTDVVSVYVLNSGGALSLYKDDACTQALSPSELNVALDTATGIYIYIASSSTTGTTFPDGSGSTPDPLTWDAGSQPSTVTLGKFRTDHKAFSISDLYTHEDEVEHGFDIIVALPGGGHTSVSITEGIDPTIVEVGEDPPPSP